MVANRTREMRLSGMTRGAYGNVNHGQGLNGHVPRKRRNSQASGLKLRAPYLLVAAGKAANLEGERPLPSIARIRTASISDARGGNKPRCART